jgi:hypothetical protein
MYTEMKADLLGDPSKLTGGSGGDEPIHLRPVISKINETKMKKPYRS